MAGGDGNSSIDLGQRRRGRKEGEKLAEERKKKEERRGEEGEGRKRKDRRKKMGRKRDSGGESDMNEPTMAEKLASLDFLDDDKAKSTANPQPSPMVNLPSASSVHLLMKQALRAEDHALLLECLYTRDEKVIADSTSLLNPADVIKLLRSLIAMIQSRGAVMVCALPWLRSLLSQHASSIVSQESSLLILNSLYQLIESRISTFGSALQLSTSLDYLFSSIPDEEAEDITIPAIIYEDMDSDEEEVADAMETDDETEGELGAVYSPRDSDGSEVISD